MAGVAPVDGAPGRGEQVGMVFLSQHGSPKSQGQHLSSAVQRLETQPLQSLGVYGVLPAQDDAYTTLLDALQLVVLSGGETRMQYLERILALSIGIFVSQCAREKLRR